MIDERKDIRAVHGRLTQELGRPPTMHELALEMGTTQREIRCFVLDDNLPITKLTPSERARIGRLKREENERRAQEESKSGRSGKKSDMRRWNIEPLDRDAIKPVRMKRLGGRLPGGDCDPGKIFLAHCMKCGRRILVRPRTHLWWIECEDGEMSPVCASSCAGVMLFTEFRMNV